MARPRSLLAHSKVLQAAIELFASRGVDATSMDAIAEASGVSKATIYKHWPDKDALCFEILDHLHRLDEDPSRFDSGDVRRDLIAALTHEPEGDRKEMKERIWPHLMAYAARHREFGETWRLRVVERPRRQIIEILGQGIAAGQVARQIDMDTAAALLIGPMIYRRVFINPHSTRPDEAFTTRVVDAFLAGYGAIHHEEILLRA